MKQLKKMIIVKKVVDDKGHCDSDFRKEMGVTCSSCIIGRMLNKPTRYGVTQQCNQYEAYKIAKKIWSQVITDGYL